MATNRKIWVVIQFNSLAVSPMYSNVAAYTDYDSASARRHSEQESADAFRKAYFANHGEDYYKDWQFFVGSCDLIEGAYDV